MICPVCKKPFTSKFKHQKTCGSPECQYKWKSMRHWKPLVKKRCKCCGTPFKTRKSLKVYCSQDCQIFSHYEKKRKRQKKSDKPKICANCKQEFYSPYTDKWCKKPECREARKMARKQAVKDYQKINRGKPRREKIYTDYNDYSNWSFHHAGTCLWCNKRTGLNRFDMCKTCYKYKSNNLPDPINPDFVYRDSGDMQAQDINWFG